MSSKNKASSPPLGGEEASIEQESQITHSNNIAICVKNLSKCYQIYKQPQDRLKQSILPRLQRLVGKQSKQYFSEFWALKDVSFEIKKGETVGIIGRNGSGKSTLLQMICGTLNPTGGSIQTNGRIAALLELGSGFNPEYTGLENVYMNAAVLGLSNKEIDARLDDIVAFAEIGKFIEHPVKTYSSGMVVRLAFAVAINVEPDILIVDEALSVGDELFQRKCFSRIETIKRGGATILFVSHSGSTIVELCDRAILLDSGQKLAVSNPKQIVGYYQKLLYAPNDKHEEIRENIRVTYGNWIRGEPHDAARLISQNTKENKYDIDDTPAELFDPNLQPQSTVEYESHGAYIGSPEIFTVAGIKVNFLKRGEIYRYIYKVRFDSSATGVHFGMMIKSISGIELGGKTSAPMGKGVSHIVTGTCVRVEFEFVCNLNPGSYYLNAGVWGISLEKETYLHRVLDICMFKVMPLTNNTVSGLVDFHCKAQLKILDSANSEYTNL